MKILITVIINGHGQNVPNIGTIYHVLVYDAVSTIWQTYSYVDQHYFSAPRMNVILQGNTGTGDKAILLAIVLVLVFLCVNATTHKQTNKLFVSDKK